MTREKATRDGRPPTLTVEEARTETLAREHGIDYRLDAAICRAGAGNADAADLARLRKLRALLQRMLPLSLDLLQRELALREREHRKH